MKLDVVVTPEAELQVRTIQEWWTANRPAAPALFVEELSAGFDLLARAPLVGHSYSLSRARGVRRLLLRAEGVIVVGSRIRGFRTPPVSPSELGVFSGTQSSLGGFCGSGSAGGPQ